MTTTKLYDPALHEHLETERIIGQIRGKQDGPTLIFIGGMHGNEPSGVLALHRAIALLDGLASQCAGNVYALSGNLGAIRSGKRFQNEDLNRIWTRDRVAALQQPDFQPEHEDELEQKEMFDVLRSIMKRERGPFYFLDLHTTSSETMPFVVMNDSLLNRMFTQQYPLPVILGIEEYLDGPLLSYINELGHVAFGYEAGQHESQSALDNHLAFIMLTLIYAGVIQRKSIDTAKYLEQLRQEAPEGHAFYEIFFRFKIKEGDDFEMEPGFVNFQHVVKGTQLATVNGLPVIADQDAQVFMPLYQQQGSEGFFAIRKVPEFFMKWSAVVRTWRIDRLLVWMPGVRWAADDRSAILVNRRIARFFTKQVFHLLGYRSRTLDRNHYLMKNREANARTRDYENALWFSKSAS